MSSIRSLSFLRRVLLVDAATSAVMGLAMIAFAGTFSALLALPTTLLFEAGIILLPFAAFVGWLASRARPPRLAVWIVIALNALWAIDSLLLLVSGWIAPNGFGYAFIGGQALAVAVLAELEYVGLRRGVATV